MKQLFCFYAHSIFLFSLCLPFLYPVLLPTLSSFFWMELWLAKLLGKRQISSANTSRKIAKLAMDFSPKCYLVFVCNSVSRISKTRYCWKHLSLLTLLLTNLIAHTDDPRRKIFIVACGTKTTKAVLKGLSSTEVGSVCMLGLNNYVLWHGSYKNFLEKIKD